MRFLLDESVERRLGGLLRADGHDVTAIGAEYPEALKDSVVLAIAVKERRVLLTNDKDFGDLIFRDKLPHAGVILFRLPAATPELKRERLKEVLAAPEGTLQNFVVVTERPVRIGVDPSRR